MKRKGAAIAGAIWMFWMLAAGQGTAYAQFVDAQPRAAARTATVEYLFPEQITAPAGRPTTAALHFRVAPGMHIQSHTPGDAYLIPTSLSFPAESGVRLASAAYPPGQRYVLAIDAKHPLSVYAGEFIIQAKIVASPGDHLTEAKLRYQACDGGVCLPPQTITAAIHIVGQ